MFAGLLLALSLLIPSRVQADEPDSRCAAKQARIEELKAELAEAVTRREAWVKDHCKLVHNGKDPKKPAAGRHWVCDGKFAGNEGTIIKSPEEIRIENRLSSVSAWITVCCGGDPPSMCRR